MALSDNFRCYEARELFSPFLDGEASSEEHDLLTGHLLFCEECRQEFELWRKISESLKLESVDEEPPADFSSRIVSRLNDEQRVRTFPGVRIPHSWRVPAAAAAAAVMLFAGSWGVGVALKDPGQKPELIANYKTGENVSKTGADQSGQTDNRTGDSSPAAPADAPKSNVGEVKPAAPAATATAHTGSTANNTALLNSNKSIASTILKISTNNPANSQDLALGMASGLGGGGQILDSQKRAGGDLIIIRMTVSRNSGPTLVTQLSGLGGILDRSDNKADITSDYNTALNRLADIQATVDSGIDAGENNRLASEASVLKRQIEKWDKEMESYAVILWLEQQ